MRTIYLDRNSKLVRYFLWCWDAKVEDLSFCSMFWGILLSPVAIIGGHVLGRSIVGWIDFGNWTSEKIQSRPKKPKKVKQPKEISKLAKSLDKMIEFLTRHKRFFEIASGIVIGIGAGTCVVTVLGYLGYYLFTETITFLEVVGALMAGTIVMVAFLLALKKIVASVLPEKIAEFFCSIGRNIKFIGSFMAEGERAFKTRTCPKVEIIGADSEHHHGEGLNELPQSKVLPDWYVPYQIDNEELDKLLALKD